LPELSADDLDSLSERLIRFALRDPECGEDFCANCGECMSCYDHATFEPHSWIVDDMRIPPEQRATIEGAVLAATGIDIVPMYTPANSEPFQSEGYWYQPY